MLSSKNCAARPNSDSPGCSPDNSLEHSVDRRAELQELYTRSKRWFSNAPNSNFSPNSTVMSTQLCRIIVCWCPHADACSMLHSSVTFVPGEECECNAVGYVCMHVCLVRARRKEIFIWQSIHNLVVFTNIIISAWKTTLRPQCGRYRDGHHNTKHTT